MSMRIILNRGKVFSVIIQSNVTGPRINLELSPTVAYELLQALDAQREEIEDMANTYYDCRECGGTHHKDVKVCPSLAKE